MINHVSIAANEPEKVANVLAAIWNGYAFPFPPCPGSFIVFDNGNKGISIEVYPRTVEMRPGVGEPSETSVFDPQSMCFDYEVQFSNNPAASDFSPTHLTINTALDETEIRALAENEGWRIVKCDRGGGFFTLLEFWIENRLMIEVFTQEMTERYQTVMQPRTYAELLGLPFPEKSGTFEPVFS